MNKLVRKIAGFTLLEIMVALFIFSIIAMIIATGLQSVLQTQQIMQKKSAELEQLEIAFILLDRDVKQIINRSIIDFQGVRQAAFLGTQAMMRFTHGGYANPLAAEKRSTLQRVSYFLQDGKLIRRTWDVLDQSPANKFSDRVLLEQITHLEIHYIDAKKRVHDMWTENNSALTESNDDFPMAIELKIIFANHSEITRLFVLNLG